VSSRAPFGGHGFVMHCVDPVNPEKSPLFSGPYQVTANALAGYYDTSMYVCDTVASSLKAMLCAPLKVHDR